MANQNLLPNGILDIHAVTSRIKTCEDTLRHHTSVSDANKEIILHFLRDCELGKTIQHSQKKRIGPARLIKYLLALQQLAIWVRKDFDKVTQTDMEELVLDIERDRYRKRGGSPFTESVKRDYKITLRKFYKWLLGKNEVYPEIVRWIDTRDVIPEIPCLRREEIEKLSQLATTPRDRAILWTLFDSGARAEEFLNIRLRHMEETKGEEGEKIYRVRIEFSKTKPRTILLPIASPHLDLYLRFHPPDSPDQPIFPLRYSNFTKILRELGKKALNKRVHPHLFRHSSATYYATRLNRAVFCYRYGWSYRSNMADRYIDREALNDQESVRAVRANTMDDLRRENDTLKEDVAHLRNQLNQIHQMMNALTADPKVTKTLAEQVKKTGQGERLKELQANLS